MGLVASIAHKLGLQILTRCDIELVDLRAAQRIIDACRQERVTVLGIEGFHVRGNQTVPDMNAIADFSAVAGLPWPERVERSVTDAKAFLGSVSDRGLLFDLTLTLEGETT